MRKSEKKILTICIIVSLTILFSIEFVALRYFYRKYIYYDKGSPIAKVGNIKIYSNDIQERLYYLNQQSEDKNISLDSIDEEMLKAVLYEIYIEKILKKEFYKKKFDNNHINYLTNSFKNNLIKEKYLKDYIINNINESDLQKKYDYLIKDIKDKEERKISHILVETEEEAERIIKLLKRNYNFEYQAEKYSIDKASAINGGSLGYLMKNEIELKDFANIAFILKQGEISKPLKTEHGWHIIKVDDIRQTELKSFDEVKDTVRQLLEQDLINDFLLNITKDIKIKMINR